MFNVTSCWKNKDDLRIIVDNCDKHELRLTDGKMYYKNVNKPVYVDVYLLGNHIFESNSETEIKVRGYIKGIDYNRISFLVKDCSIDLFYEVVLSFENQDPKIKEVKNKNLYI